VAALIYIITLSPIHKVTSYKLQVQVAYVPTSINIRYVFVCLLHTLFPSKLCKVKVTLYGDIFAINKRSRPFDSVFLNTARFVLQNSRVTNNFMNI